MKTFLFLTTIICSLLADYSGNSNGNRNNNNRREKEKLPAKITHGSWRSTIFQYDNENRIIKILSSYKELDEMDAYEMDAYEYEIEQTLTYGADGKPTKLKWESRNNYGGSYSDEWIFQYSGNQVSFSEIYRKVFTINASGQLVKSERDEYLPDDGPPSPPSIKTEIFTYDSNGNLTEINEEHKYSSRYGSAAGQKHFRTRIFIHSDIKTIWRYVNAPDWMLYYLFDYVEFGRKTGYMPISYTETMEYTYQKRRDRHETKYTHVLDSDGYVKQIKSEEIGTVTIEYVPAK